MLGRQTQGYESTVVSSIVSTIARIKSFFVALLAFKVKALTGRQAIIMVERVLEIGGYAAGYCGRLFARAGADVVRIQMDSVGPAWASDEAMSAFLHGGKRLLSSADGQLIAELANAADILIVEAQTANALSAMDFDGFSTPVKLAMTPFGRTGPKCNWNASGNVMLAMGGYTHLMGDPDRAPLSLPGHYLEFQTAALGYTAINACRMAGQHKVIDLGMFETLLALSQFTSVRWQCAGEQRERHGSDFWYVVPSNLFVCADGWVYLNIVPSFWDPLTVFLERPELLLDSRFLTNDLRMENREALHAIVGEILAPLSKAEIFARAQACRIPLGVVQSFAEVLDDPHLQARSFFAHSNARDVQPWRIPENPYCINGERRTVGLGPITSEQVPLWRA